MRKIAWNRFPIKQFADRFDCVNFVKTN